MGKQYTEEGSTFTHDGVTYDLNYFLKKASSLPVKQLEIKELEWLLSDAEEDQARVEKADISVPLLVTRWEGKWVTIDGWHRFLKAHAEGVKKLPIKEIPSSWFSDPAARPSTKKTKPLKSHDW